MIFNRVRTLLGLVPATPAPAPPAPLPILGEELAAAGIAEREWLANQRRGGRVYADIDERHLGMAAERFPGRVAETINAAARVLRHEFSFLGSGWFTPIDPDRRGAGDYRPIDWRLDPVRGFRFPAGVPHTQWNFETMRTAGADIKLPWELGRCQHMVTLGQAYRLTGDDRYAREIFDQIEDFSEANPAGMGVQWTCTMDVAIRAANWTLSLALARGCDRIDEARWLAAYRRLFEHGGFIENNLENKYEVTSNHFLSNVAGLFLVAAVFRDLPSGARWHASCRAWLEQELRTQVLADGADYESSIPYHRLVTELFLSGARLASMHGAPLSPEFTTRLRAMCAYLAAVQRPDGLMPQVGDADDGRLHIFTAYGSWRPQDGRHLLACASAFFDEPEWQSLAGEDEQWEAAWWGFELPATMAGSEAPVAAVRHFPDAGITVFRTSRTFLLITNGVVGTAGFGNHKHNDQLAFEYHVDGTPLFVDPGSGVYTSDPASRNRFRGTASHNTMMIDGVEQNEIKFEWLFRMFETSRPEHLRVQESGNTLEYDGRHSGYARLPAPVAHTRRFALDRTSNTLRIVDNLEGQGRHRLTWHFHCAPGVTAAGAGGAIEIGAGAVSVRLVPPPGLDVAIVPALYSPSYGVRTACVAIELQADVQLEGSTQYVFDVIPCA